MLENFRRKKEYSCFALNSVMRDIRSRDNEVAATTLKEAKDDDEKTILRKS